MAPPVFLQAKWFAGHVAYAVSKFGMAIMTFGIAVEFSESGIAFNCLWPRTIIKTAALAMIPGIDTDRCRTPEIVTDAANAILTKEPAQLCGQFCIDEEILKSEGMTNFDKYAVNPQMELVPDLYVEQ